MGFDFGEESNLKKYILINEYINKGLFVLLFGLI